jgi:hypothetical protein
MTELEAAIAVILATPSRLLKADPLLRERHKAARALTDALGKDPVDADECSRLADRLLQVCGAPAGPVTRQ